MKIKKGMTEYNEEIYYSLGQNAGDAGGGMNMAAWGWNLGSGYLHVPAPALYYLFKTDNISEYDPYADIVENGGITSNALYEWIKGYNKTYENGTLLLLSAPRNEYHCRTAHCKGGAGRNGNARKERLNYGKHQNSRRVSRHIRKSRRRFARSRYGFKI